VFKAFQMLKDQDRSTIVVEQCGKANHTKPENAEHNGAAIAKQED
jgi:hypothetical protein